MGYWLFVGCSWLWQRMPLKLGYALATLIADLGFLFWRRGRRNAIENMRRVMGLEATPEQVKRAARASLRNYCKSLADFLRFPRLTPQDIDRLVEYERWDVFDQSLAAGRGVIFLTLHMGNWDLGAAAIAHHGYRLSVIVDAFQPAKLDEMVRKTREEKGVHLVPEKRGARGALRALRENQVLALLMDRPTPGQGVRVEFFGAPAYLPAGAATLALKTGAKVLPGCLVRKPDNAFQGIVLEPLEYSPCGVFEEDVSNLTQLMTKALERLICAFPEQWYMFRPMWQGNPPLEDIDLRTEGGQARLRRGGAMRGVP